MRSPLSSTESGASAAGSAALAPPQGDPGQLAREILADGDYQTELPTGQEQELPDLSFLGEILPVLFWVGVAVLAIWLVVWLVRWISGPRAVGEELEFDLAPAGDVASGAPTLEDAERLAQAGRFGEATHLLLLAAIARLGAGLERPPQPADTSREILRALPLRGAARNDLRHLVGRVEVFLFGGRDLIESEYRECRERFSDLVGEARA